MELFGRHDLQWLHASQIQSADWDCGYCGNRVSSNSGWTASAADRDKMPVGFVRICPGCTAPTFFDRGGNVYPAAQPGKSVERLPDEIRMLYEEARRSASATAYTSAVLVCRKILMHIAVEEGAKPGGSFLSYIEDLSDKGFIPPHGKAWVDYVRTRGNEANHEIVIMAKDDALALISFVEMLLRFIYEFPRLVPATILPTSL
jgi:hypothetical protein